MSSYTHDTTLERCWNLEAPEANYHIEDVLRLAVGSKTQLERSSDRQITAQCSEIGVAESNGDAEPEF